MKNNAPDIQVLYCTSALIVLSHNDRGVGALTMQSKFLSIKLKPHQNRTKTEEKLKIPTSEFYICRYITCVLSFETGIYIEQA